MKTEKQKKYEYNLIMLGYNAALLDYATFPIIADDIALTRQQVVVIVEKLKEKTGR